jgi:hypothetical protein
MELNSLNDKLYDEFFIQELETRLETDPLMVGGLVDLFDSQDSSLSCFCIGKCIEHSCGSHCTIDV